MPSQGHRQHFVATAMLEVPKLNRSIVDCNSLKFVAAIRNGQQISLENDITGFEIFQIFRQSSAELYFRFQNKDFE